MASQLYYYCLCVAALAVGILNFASQSIGKSLTCFSAINYKTEDYDAALSSKAITINKDFPPIKKPDGTIDVPQASSNLLSLFQFIIAIGYLSILGLTFFLAILVNFLSNQIPEDFITMGKCKHFLAAFCKILPVLIVLLHWVLLIAIIVNWIMIITESCKYSQVNSGPSVSKEQYFIDSRTNLIVTSVIWFFLHYIGSILKDLSYVEPFMYTPKTQESNSFLHVSFRVLGP